MKTSEPCTLMIFGAGGNLSRRKLIPALFRLETAKRLPEQMVILGCDIALRSHDEWLSIVAEILRPVYPPNMVYYMAGRPADYPAIVEKLGNAGLLKQKNGWRRVVIEKPFGYDLLSAQTLQASLYRHLDEPQIYRIDHYLGKG